MNKDLDDRLIPNGEYRDAQNISVGRSESDSVGSLENIIGNSLQATLVDVANEFVIGVYNDEPNERLYYFITTNNSQNITCTACSNFIVAYNTNGVVFDNGLVYKTIVEGTFLNFSSFFPITGINLIDNLLFWTDNRNQPRVVNVTNELGYYTKETDVSVAKFSPYEPISLLKTTTSTLVSQAVPTPAVFVLNIAANENITVGMYVTAGTTVITDLVQVTKVVSSTQLHLTAVLANVSPGNTIVTFVGTTMTNENDTPLWPGDPNYLEDRFVRFSYRYRYADGEYSVFAPFTQPAFIPKQKGYFINGNEEDAYRSTILNWMENEIQNVELLIPLPDVGAKIGVSPTSSYKINEIDILYKESDGLVVKVLDTISHGVIQAQSPTTNVYKYNYQSTKPYKTLTQAQTIRVYDQIPTRALAQESSGNRVIYGNFYDKYSPPPNGILYQVGVNKKQISTEYQNFAEYPNSTLKQNRNYQVGFVLGDKFGRQTSVLLSNLIDDAQLINGVKFGSSTIFAPYDTQAENVKTWFGDALQVYLENAIVAGGTSTYISGPTELPNTSPTQIGSDPGLYAMAKNGNTGFNATAGSSVTGKVYTFTLTGAATGVPVTGDFLRGEFTDYVKVLSTSNTGAAYIVTCDGDVNIKLYSITIPATNPDPKYCYKINETGWYSYKIVVKQQEQDYYNAYLPGILNGYPAQITTVPSPNPGNIDLPTPFPVNEENKIANIVLINDNINKIPRDLAEVGPDQKQFSSSVELYGRVNNTATSNVQFYPGNFSDTAISISTADDSNMVPNTLSTIGKENLYQVDTNPLIARVSTSLPIGVTTATMTQQLAVYETQPVESILDLYWESTTTGLISDLNADINSGFNGAVGFSAFTYSQTEASPIGFNVLSTGFTPVNAAGASIVATLSNFTATDQPGNNIGIILTDDGGETPAVGYTGPWKLKTTANFVYDYAFAANKFQNGQRFKFTMTFTSSGQSSVLSFFGNLTNLAPSFTGTSLSALSVPTGAANPIRTLTGINGASSDPTTGLKFLITNQPAGNYFTINAVTGALSVLASTPIGAYSLTLTVSDTYSSAAAGVGLGDGFLTSAPGTLVVTVGPAALNAGAISPCVDSSVTPNAANTITVPNTSTTINACWYLSNNTLVSSATPASNDFEGTGFPGSNPSATQNGGQPWRLGSNAAGKSDVSTGTIVFSINVAQNKTTNNLTILSTSVDHFVVWKRTPAIGGTPATAWVKATDINNKLQSPLEQGILLTNVNINTKKYSQFIFAFEAPSSNSEEYAIVGTNIECTNATVTGEFPQITVNSQDLNNDVCVIIPDGTGTNYGTAAVTTPKSYRYQVGTPNGPSNTGAPGGGAVGGVNLFAFTAYGEYVQQFYTTYQLTTKPDWTNATGAPGNVAYDGANNAAYPWNAFSVVTSNTPGFTTMTEYEDYNFSARMNATGGVLTSTGGNVANYGNTVSVPDVGTLNPLLRISNGTS